MDENTKSKGSYIFNKTATVIAKMHNKIWPWQMPEKWIRGVRFDENSLDKANSSYYQEIEYNYIKGIMKYNLYDMAIPKGACLDIGCGVGGMTYSLASTGNWSLNVGLDVDKSRIKAAQYYAKINGYNDNVSFLIGDGKRLPFVNNSISLVFAVSVLEHVYEWEDLVREVIRVLKEGGIAVFSFPPFLSPQFRHLSAIIKMPWIHLLLGEKMTVAVAREILRLNGQSSVTIPLINYKSPSAELVRISVFGFIRELMRINGVTVRKLHFERYFRFLPMINYLPILSDLFSDHFLLILQKHEGYQVKWVDVIYCWYRSVQNQLKRWMKLINRFKS